MDFADECDSAVVHLKAAALPRQSTQVILPITAMKETEIYAPNYSDPDVVRERATPRASTQLSEARVNRIKAMANSGSTNSEIADALGISPSVVSKYLNE